MVELTHLPSRSRPGERGALHGVQAIAVVRTHLTQLNLQLALLNEAQVSLLTTSEFGATRIAQSLAALPDR